MEKNTNREASFLRAKKKVQEIKGFYSHLTVVCILIPFLIFINLRFVPQYHWFWFPIGGLGFSLLIHWMAVFGYKAFGLGSDWEARKIQQLMEEDNKFKNI
jgi:uncharacterized membrane protein